MFSPGTRRDFLRIVSASAVSLSALPEWARAWWFAETTLPRSKDLPKIDGALIFNDEARERMATDIGGNFHRLPVAVLRPRSVEDVPKVVHFANKNGVRIAMRGQGHSQYGSRSGRYRHRFQHSQCSEAQGRENRGCTGGRLLGRGPSPAAGPGTHAARAGR